MQILKVLIEYSADEIDRTFDYLLNDEKDGRIWDSLAAVAFLDLVEDNGGKHYDSTEVLANCKTVKDLWIFYQNNLVEKDAI